MKAMVRALVGTCIAAGAISAAAAPLPDVCIDNYGNPPRPHTASVDALVNSLYPVGLACVGRGGEVLTWTDRENRPRLACLQIPPGTSKTSQRPLIVFLGGSLFKTDPQGDLSRFAFQYKDADLTGDPARPGYIYLSIEGRDTKHFYPFPDDTGLGWDNWYRNLDRDHPGLNLDVAAIDHFIEDVKSRGIVDRHRVYMSGWSNGAAMAILYGMNTRGIAATSVYSSPDPFGDLGDPCPQAPFATNNRPVMMIHNRCDIGGICTTGSVGFTKEMDESLPRIHLTSIIIKPDQAPAAHCTAACDATDNPLSLLTPGALLHLRWPAQWNDEMYKFLREHPLP